MFCNRCGATLEQGQRFCSQCGNSVSEITSAASATVAHPSRLQGHLRILAILWFVASAFIFLPGVFLLGFSSQIVGFFPPEVPDFVSAMLPGVGIFMTAIAAVGFLAGWGLLERAPWARILSIVLAFFSLFHFPLGTALGIYTLWVLLPESSEQEYRQGTARYAGARA